MVEKIGVIETQVDELLRVLKEVKTISLADLARRLGVHTQTVQAWVDFLVEERIVGIEYRFTTPYVYLNDEEMEDPRLHENKPESQFDSKIEFYQKAAKRGLGDDQIKVLWQKYLTMSLDMIKEEFYRRSEKRDIPAKTIDRLWNKFLHANLE